MISLHATGSVLYLDDVSVTFDGFRAINKLALVLNPGEMRAIIGPNGAGKTTMMDIITGKTKPDTGDIIFDETQNLLPLDETEIANLGIGRKFQKPTVFENHKVSDNIRLALSGERSTWSSFFGSRNEIKDDQIDEVLSRVRMLELRDKLAGDLSHGQKQWLEIAMLLAQDPKLLLVDEPVAGMTDAETEETARLLREIAVNHSVVVVEHDMSFVRALECKVTCLHEGTVISEGSIDEVSNDERVIEVYLGR